MAAAAMAARGTHLEGGCELAAVRAREECVAGVGVVEALHELGVGRLWQTAHLIYQMEDARGDAWPLVRNQGDAPGIVWPLDGTPRNPLLGVELLLSGEDVLVESRLELLIGEINEELLEGIDRKRLEAKDVE